MLQIMIDHITGGKKFSLQNGGWGTCAVAFNQSEFVLIGGADRSDIHGKVDRCLNRHHCHHCPHSPPGTTLKANTWVPFPTCPKQDLDTAAQAF